MGKVLFSTAISLLFVSLIYAETPALDVVQLINEAQEHKSLGVLVSSTENAKGSLCTVTHIALGKVLTSARCVLLSSDPSKYNLIYFNQESKRSVIPIEKIFFTGPLWVDVAVLTISAANAKTWEVAGNEIKSYNTQNVFDQYWNDSSETESVEVWGYRQTDKTGVLQFSKTKCTAARKIPVIEMKVKEDDLEKTVHEWQVTGEDVNPDHVLFLDACLETVSGNGSLITVQKSFSKKIAVLSQYIADLGKVYTTQSQSQYKEQETNFYFRGILSPSRPLNTDFSDLNVVMGTFLQSAAALKKDLFQNLY